MAHDDATQGPEMYTWISIVTLRLAQLDFIGIAEKIGLQYVANKMYPHCSISCVIGIVMPRYKTYFGTYGEGGLEAGSNKTLKI